MFFHGYAALKVKIQNVKIWLKHKCHQNSLQKSQKPWWSNAILLYQIITTPKSVKVHKKYIYIKYYNIYIYIIL